MPETDVVGVGDSVAPVLATDEDGRLYYGDRRVAFTKFDRSYIAAAAAAFERGKDIALVYPSPPTHVQIPVVLSTGYQSQSHGDPPVMFVSNRPGIREQYFNLGLGPRVDAPGLDPDPLGSVTTPLVKTGDGTRISHVTGHEPRDWSEDEPDRAAIIHTTFGKKITQTLPSDLELSGFVLDFTTGMLDDPSDAEKYRYLAEERDIPRVMVFDTPNHSYLETLAGQARSDDEPSIVFWGWSPDELESAPDDLFAPVASHVDPGDETRRADGGTVPSPFTDSLQSLRNLSSGIERSVVRIPYGEYEQVAKEAYRRISSVANFPDTSSYSSASRSAISEAYFVYMYLDTLLTSVDYHDSLAAMEDSASWGAVESLGSKVRRLQDRAPVLESDVTGAGALFEEACSALDSAVDVIESDNPKADALAEEIRRSIESGESVSVLTATRKQESIVRSFVAEKTELSREGQLGSRVEFHSIYSPHTIPSADVLLFPGVPTRSHYPAVGTGAAAQQRYLCYDWEVDRLEHRISDATSRANSLVGPAVKHYFMDYLGIENNLDRFTQSATPRPPTTETGTRSGGTGGDHQSGDDPVLDSDHEVRSDVRSTPRNQRIGTSDSVSIEDLDLDLDSMTPDTGDESLEYQSEVDHDDGEKRETIDAGRAVVQGTEESTDQTDAIEIQFVDGTYLYEKPRGLVWVLQGAEGGDVTRERRAAASLEEGEQLLLIEDDSRRDVFEHVVEKIHSECRGEFRSSLTMLDLWTSGIDRVVSKVRDRYEEEQLEGFRDSIGLRQVARTISNDLQDYETESSSERVSREPVTVFQWLNKHTLGPSTPEVIQALGDIYEVEVLRSQYRRIFSGLEDVRHLHQNVGSKLGDIVFSVHGSSGDEWLLEECGLRVEDVQDVTVVKLVETVDDETRPVDSRRVGKLEEEPL